MCYGKNMHIHAYWIFCLSTTLNAKTCTTILSNFFQFFNFVISIFQEWLRNLVKHRRWNSSENNLQVTMQFSVKLYLRCLAGSWIQLCRWHRRTTLTSKWGWSLEVKTLYVIKTHHKFFILRRVFFLDILTYENDCTEKNFTKDFSHISS